MFLIRQAKLDDGPALLKLAKMVHFINLPADPDVIHRKITASRRAFARQATEPKDRQFLLVLEDTETGNVIGTSSVMAAISWAGHPHTFFQVRRRELYSTDLNTGQVHTTLQLGTDESGWSEIGGLIISPSYRGHRQKLGQMLSLVRFHLIGMYRSWFSDKIIAEMMAPLTPDSRNTLWEYLGRRFINLSYAEADAFCQHSKEFITSLFPKDEIYVSILPAVARNLIAKVGPETEPAKAMLERLGFRYAGHVDPFDGGPYLEAQVDDIQIVRETRELTLGKPAEAHPEQGFVSCCGPGGFRAVRTMYAVQGETVSIPPEAAALLGVQDGDGLGVSPLVTRQAAETTAVETAIGAPSEAAQPAEQAGT